MELLTKKVGKGGKGSHTTTWSEIIDCRDFYLIDSPGIRSFSLDDILPSDLISYFPDLEEYAIHCRFPDCVHSEETPGCSFYREGADISNYLISRLDSYKKLLEEISVTPDWDKKM